MQMNTATDNTRAQQLVETRYNWDFFISHPGADTEQAKILYKILYPPSRVFLDAVCMVAGDNWDSTLSAELEASLISVIMITPNTEKAYYEQEEIAMAIDMARADKYTHRVVPVYIELTGEIPRTKIPFGLRRKHSLYIKNTADFAIAGEQLFFALETMKKCEVKKDVEVKRNQEAVMMIASPASSGEFFTGFKEIVRYVGVLLIVSAVLFTVTLGALIIVAFSDTERKDMLLLILGSFCAFFACGFLWLIAKAFKITSQIATGKVNAN